MAGQESVARVHGVCWTQTARGEPLPLVTTVATPHAETAEELQRWFGRISCDPWLASGQSELRAILTGRTWRWREFEEWYERFSQLEYFPYMWSGLEVLPERPSDATRELLTRFSALPWDARLLADELNVTTNNRTSTLTEFEFKRKCGLRGERLKTALRALDEAGLIVTSISVGDRLLSLKNEDLGAALEARGLPKGGKKAEMVERLVENVPEDQLFKLLPATSQQDMIRINALRTLSDDDDFLRYEQTRIHLLHHTVQFSVLTAVKLTEYSGRSDIELQVSRVHDNCPICDEYEGVLLQAAGGPFPPFHPGCRCALTPHFEGYDDAFGDRTQNPINTERAAPSRPATTKPSGGCGCGAVTLALGLYGMSVVAVMLLR